LFKKNGFTRPTTWIMPGGDITTTESWEVHDVQGKKYNYISSACWSLRAAKVFNEPNSKGDYPFGMTWTDTSLEKRTAEEAIKKIAHQTALHHVLTDGSHMGSFDGWDNYMLRLDKVISWCVENDIPIKTQSQWAAELYHQQSNPKINIFPLLSRDTDKDNVPDGYTLKKASYEEQMLIISETGTAFEIIDLGGLEKGQNTLSLTVAAKDTATLKIKIDYFKAKKKFLYNTSEEISFNLSPDKQDYSTTIKIPGNAATCDITVNVEMPDKTNILISDITLNQ
jgi:hypothetical protein